MRDDWDEPTPYKEPEFVSIHPPESQEEAEREFRQFWARVWNVWPLVVGLIILLMLIRGVGFILFWLVAVTGAVLIMRTAIKDRPLMDLAKEKLKQWRQDFRSLIFFTVTAAKRNKTDRDTLAMAQQTQFLSGRLLSPVNIFTFLPYAVAAVGFSFGAWQMSVASDAKRDRDAPCTTEELTGETSRVACADQGETLRRAEEWVSRAGALETALENEKSARAADAETLKNQIAETRETMEARSRADRQLRARAGRRTNEVLSSVLGGSAPDWERSVSDVDPRTEPPAGSPDASGGDDPGTVPSNPAG